ncbi:hypothetical protein ACFLQ6_00915 [Thermoproteota archaeon]
MINPKMPAIIMTILLVGMALTLVAPVMAPPGGNGPKYTKYVSPLKNGADERWGQVICNVNPEDDGTYELEVEIEEYMPFAESIVNVKLDGTSLGTIEVDENGNGKATFYVTAFDPASNTIEIVFDTTLTPAMIALRTTTGDFHEWVKVKGPK